MTTPSYYSPPPLSPYGTLNGCSLFQYHQNLVAVESSAHQQSSSCPNKCILLGGLSDGLLATPYVVELHEKISDESSLNNNWSLVQPLLSSSYLGFGSGTLERDSVEIDHLLEYLTTHRSASLFCLIGHSTGCQNIVHYLKKKYGQRNKIKLIVLQAPVSDREHLQTEDNYKESLELAENMIQNEKESEMMPRNVFWAPITARRYYDLASFHGADDFFSSDLSDEELNIRLGHVSKSPLLKLLCAFSGSDEYVPEHIDKQQLLERLCRAMNNKHAVATPLYLPLSNHNLSNNTQERQLFVDKVIELLSNIDE